MELAEPKVGTTLVTTEGMDELFRPGTTEGTEPTERSGTVESEAVEVITTDEAAKRLGITTRAVLKRLATGSLSGFRDSTKKKAEWRVHWYRTNEPEAANSDGRSGTGSEAIPKSSESLRYLTEQNQKLIEQNQTLIYRNGYLEAQLAEKDVQLKLLTDNQKHRTGWWSRFSTWLGR